jgi:hypothetical protein
MLTVQQPHYKRQKPLRLIGTRNSGFWIQSTIRPPGADKKSWLTTFLIITRWATTPQVTQSYPNPLRLFKNSLKLLKLAKPLIKIM